MKVQLFKRETEGDEEGILLDSFRITNVKDTIASEIAMLTKERSKAKKKAAREKAKKANETKSNDTEPVVEAEPEPEEPDAPIPVPKLKVSVEFSRSGYLQVTKANAGSLPLELEQDRKSSQLTPE